MKYKVIQLPQGSIAIDETAEIKEGDFIYVKNLNKPIKVQSGWNNNLKLACYKIIASTFFIHKDIAMWKPEDELELRKIVAAQQYALSNCIDNMSSLTKVKLAWENGFEVGYKAAQAKGSYSEEDLRAAYGAGRDYQIGEYSEFHGGNEHTHPDLNTFIQSLNQPTVEFETEDKNNEEIEKEIGTFGHDQGLTENEYDEYLKYNSLQKIKTTTDSEGQKWCHIKPN